MRSKLYTSTHSSSQNKAIWYMTTIVGLSRDELDTCLLEEAGRSHCVTLQLRQLSRVDWGHQGSLEKDAWPGE